MKFLKLVFILLIMTAIFSNLIIRNLSGFSPQEQHPLFVSTPPLTSDIPAHFQKFDGNKNWFHLIDTNKNSKIEKSEILKLNNLFIKLSILFTKNDMNHDNFLNKKEFRSFHAALKAKNLSGFKLFSNIKTLNLNDFIRKTAFMRINSSLYFEKFDKNRDSSVDFHEFEGAPVLRTFWLGTDNRGRDIFARTVAGLRLSLVVGFASALLGLFLGLILGTFSALSGKIGKTVIMRGVDVFYAVPYIFIIMILVTILGKGVYSLIISIGFAFSLSVTRIVFGEILKIRSSNAMLSLKLLNIPFYRTIFVHILLRIRLPLIYFGTILVGEGIIFEAFLSFLGFGVTPETPSLGIMIIEGTKTMYQNHFSLIIPCLILSFIVYATYMIGKSFVNQKRGGYG